MKTNSYFKVDDNSLQDYTTSDSYVVTDESGSSDQVFQFFQQYDKEDLSLGETSLLPNDYDVFSDLSSELFSSNRILQNSLIIKCFAYMKSVLLEIYRSFGIIRPLPKINFIKTIDGSFTFSFMTSTYRIFLLFDDEKTQFGHYGILTQKDEDSFNSEIKRFTIEDYKKAITHVILSLLSAN